MSLPGLVRVPKSTKLTSMTMITIGIRNDATIVTINCFGVLMGPSWASSACIASSWRVGPSSGATWGWGLDGLVTHGAGSHSLNLADGLSKAGLGLQPETGCPGVHSGRQTTAEYRGGPGPPSRRGAAVGSGALESKAVPCDRGEVDIMRPSEGHVASSILAGRTNTTLPRLLPRCQVRHMLGLLGRFALVQKPWAIALQPCGQSLARRSQPLRAKPIAGNCGNFPQSGRR